MKMKTLHHFDAAHLLKGYNGPCANLHGHRWEIEVAFEIRGVDALGISLDFKEVKRRVASVLPDHAFLNDHYGDSPTAERLALALLSKIMAAFEGTNLEVVEVTLFEAPGCAIVVKPHDLGQEDRD